MKIETRPMAITDQGIGSPLRRPLMRAHIAGTEIDLAVPISIPTVRLCERTGTDSAVRRLGTGIGSSMYLRQSGTSSRMRLPRNGTESTALLLPGATIYSGNLFPSGDLAT